MMGHPDALLPVNPPPYTYSEAYAQAKSRSSRSRLARRAATTVILGLIVVFLGCLLSISLVHRDSSQHIFQDGLQRCELFDERVAPKPDQLRSNPRWNAVNGHQKPIILRNATLFDGEIILEYQVDILFENGVVKAITRTIDEDALEVDNTEVTDLQGQYVTPGLVDMHSHHGEMPFHSLSGNRDVNETPLLGPITPLVRSIDAFKSYDPAIRIELGEV